MYWNGAAATAGLVVLGSRVWGAAAQGLSVPLDLTPYFNAKAFGTYPGEASLDRAGNSLPAPSVGTNGTYRSRATGLAYNFPGYTGAGQPDHVVSLGQTVAVPAASYFSASMLLVSNGSDAAAGDVTFHYSDGSTSVSEARAKPFLSEPVVLRGEIILPFYYTADGVNGNTTDIHELTAPLEPGKNLTGFSLPATNLTDAAIDVFAVTLWRGSGVLVQSVRPTQRSDDARSQIVELTVNNAGAACVSGRGLTASISAPGIAVEKAGTIRRLCPGDQKRVNIVTSGSYTGAVTATVEHDGGGTQNSTFEGIITLGLSEYTTELDSLARHESPGWFNDAKYGVFIHWGPYSAPGWGNSTPYEQYSEWFWYWSTHPDEDVSDTRDWRLRTYGPDWNYDDSFSAYDASAWDPKEWVDLFADAGAKYFVLTTKHHDGFGLFDTGNTSDRHSLLYGPKRDLLKDLFDAAKQHQPSLHRGTYFSMPEWFNPDFGKYGFSSWPGIIARNPYTGLEEPYTGRLPIDDYLEDLQLPQMESLAFDYESEIMWCDIGGPNLSPVVAAAWYNQARSQGREVTMNARCGVAQLSDWDTPEYETFASAQLFKWESSQGMDPYSYAYNRATADHEYMNASVIIRSLVDIVAKNGNFLLDIGPMANGSIPQVEVDNLREAGRWINAHEAAIFNTTYWFVQTEVVEDDVRFTQTDDAFYIIALRRPALTGGTLAVNAPVPILEGDVVSMVGVAGGKDLPWTRVGEGNSAALEIAATEDMLAEEQYAWVFKIAYAVK